MALLKPQTDVGAIRVVSGSFTRPADATQYVSGDLIANSTTAGSVTPVALMIGRGNGGLIRKVRLFSTGKSTTNASFRVHVYSVSPVVSNGDNGVWLTDNGTNYRGAMDVTFDKVFTDVAQGNGVPNTGNEMSCATDNCYILLEARNTYTPISGEVFTIELEVLQY